MRGRQKVGEKRRRNFFFPVFFIAAFLLAMEGRSWAFSMGSIEVKSQFNKKFEAQIPLVLDGAMETRALIGDDMDYRRLGLERPKVADRIILTLLVESEKKGKILLHSDEPLYQPSLNLVIKCTHNGGTFLENYLIAVDFQKSLALNLPPKNPEKEEEKSEEEEEKPKEEPKIEEVQPVVAAEEKKREEATVEKKPPLEVIPSAPAIEAPVEEEVIIPQTPPVKTDKVESAKEKKRVVVKARKGDTLYRIAGRLKAPAGKLEQVVVALWEKNLDKFEKGNMNLLAEGVELELEGVLEKASSYTRREARKIIRGQWREKKGRKGAGEVILRAGGAKTELQLPYEISDDEAHVYRRVLEWKKRWEERDIDHFMALYSPRFRYGVYDYRAWKRYKKLFNAKHGKFELQIEEVQIRRDEKRIIASFSQHFKSKRMETVGTKLLYFVKSGQEHRIVKEVWQKELTRGKSHPYVLHISSYRNRAHALKEVNLLRSKGYSSYEVLFNTVRGAFYRVVIDRFPTKGEANRFGTRLTRRGIVDYAIPMKLPYALETALLKNREAALKEILRLRKLGISPYPLTQCYEDGCRFRILIGAYTSEEHARKVVRTLEKKGTESRIVQP